MLDLSSLALEDIASALADQTDYERRWLISPQTGEVAFWTADTGIDGQAPVDLDDLDLVVHRSAAILGLVPGHGRLRRNHYRCTRRTQAGTGHPGQGSLPPVQR